MHLQRTPPYQNTGKKHPSFYAMLSFTTDLSKYDVEDTETANNEKSRSTPI